jgi:hypothetical protein
MLEAAVDQALVKKMINYLRQELREVVHAIWALEAVARGKPVRGRPPGQTGGRHRIERRGKKLKQKKKNSRQR